MYSNTSQKIQIITHEKLGNVYLVIELEFNQNLSNIIFNKII